MNPVSAQAAVVGKSDPTPPVESSGPSVDVSRENFPETLVPVYSRGMALGVLAVLASVFALSWAQSFAVPLLLGIVFTYTLNPLVVWLEKIRIPRVVGTTIVMASVIGLLALGTYSLRGQVQTIIEQLPEAATKLASGLARLQNSQTGSLQKMQQAATEVEKATTQAPGGAVAPHQPTTHVIVDPPTFKLGTFLWQSSMG